MLATAPAPTRARDNDSVLTECQPHGVTEYGDCPCLKDVPRSRINAFREWMLSLDERLPALVAAKRAELAASATA